MNRVPISTALVMLFLFAFAAITHADDTIANRSVEINGAKVHYMTAGHGIPLILLHGYAET
jgi:hypothetical protein